MAQVKWRLSKPQPGKKASIIAVLYISDSIRPEVSTGEKVLPTNWTGSRVKNAPDRGSINQHLTQIEGDLMQVWRDNKHADRSVILDLVKKAVKGGGPIVEKKRLTEAVQRFIAQYAQEKESTTVKMYKSILKKLEKFNPDLGFEDLDFNFYDAFKKFLYGNPNPVFSGFSLDRCNDSGDYCLSPSDKPLNPVGLFDDTVYKYIVHLKTICAWAEKRGYNVHPSFKEWSIIKREYEIISINLDELQRIENLTGLPPHLNTARDYFSICCRTGQRISDVKRISALAISTGTWTIQQKKGSRQKQKVVQLPLVGFTEPVKDIVNKYGGKLPEMSEQHLNKHIKEICKLAKIDQEIYTERWQGNKKIKIPGKKYEFITSHSGKKAFITILASMGVPIKVISDLTGTTIKTIEKHYLGKTELYIIDNYLKGIESPGHLRKAN